MFAYQVFVFNFLVENILSAVKCSRNAGFVVIIVLLTGLSFL